MDNVDRVKPVTPDDIHEQKLKDLPDGVISVWNTAIAKNWRGSNATVYQKDIVDDLEKAGYKRTTTYSQGYLDIESIYEAAGWDVEYDKPAYNETYDAKFIFTRKKK